jgi:hypothetical protein
MKRKTIAMADRTCPSVVVQSCYCRHSDNLNLDAVELSISFAYCFTILGRKYALLEALHSMQHSSNNKGADETLRGLGAFWRP